jgi:hypothetical protein
MGRLTDGDPCPRCSNGKILRIGRTLWMHLFYRSERYMCEECDAKFFLPFGTITLREPKGHIILLALYFVIIISIAGLISFVIVQGPGFLLGLKYHLK